MTPTEHLLMILAEEGAEVTQRASKAQRFGLCEVQPGQPLNNQERISEEVNDLLAVLEMLGIPFGDRAAIEARKAKVIKYATYAVQCGTLAAPPERGKGG